MIFQHRRIILHIIVLSSLIVLLTIVSVVGEHVIRTLRIMIGPNLLLQSKKIPPLVSIRAYHPLFNVRLLTHTSHWTSGV